MERLFRRTRAEVSLFWRYLILLALVAGLFLGAMTLSTRQSARVLQQTYLDQVEGSFYANADLFAGDLLRTYDLLTAMEESEYFSDAARVTAPPLPRDNYILSCMGNTFARQCNLLNLSGESFLYFRQAGACATRHRYFSKADACFDSYLAYDWEQSMPELLDQSLAARGIARSLSLLPVCNVSVDGAAPAPCLTLLVQDRQYDQVYGFLYPEQAILDYFQIGALPGESCFRLVRSDGETLFSRSNPAASDYVEFSRSLPSLSCTAVLSIPRSYFQDAIRAAQTTTRTIFLACVFLGFAMCVVFSHISVLPFRRLIRRIAPAPDAERPANELAAIDRFLTRAQQTSTDLRNMLLSSLLVRICSGLPIPEQERRALDADPLFRRTLHAALLRGVGDADPDRLRLAVSALQKALADPFVCEYTGMQECVFLFDPARLELLQRTLLELQQGSSAAPDLVCGVSTPFEGLDGLAAAIRQARFCVPEDGERIITLFSAEELPAAAAGAAVFDYRQFQQALACWSRQDLLSQIEACARSVEKGRQPGNRAQEAFYSMLHLLRDAAATGQLSFAAYEQTAWLHTISPAANLRGLEQAVNDLFRQRENIQKSDKQLLREDIVQYVKDNFSDHNLCMTALIQQFCVSESFIRNSILSATGMTFVDFLAMLRMETAARLLRDTDEPVAVVAERCGYAAPSSFFRNFRKYHGLSPMEYKNSAGAAGAPEE